MKNRIDLSKYQIRTDLVIENLDNEKNSEYINVEKIAENIKVTTIEVDNNLCQKLNKKTGTYITIEFEDVTNHEDQLEVTNTLENELKKILKKQNIKENDNCLIIGLGNKDSTADSLGPKVIDKVLVTRHLFELKTEVKPGIRNISAIAPGVMATTGIETYDIITSLVDKIKPKFLILIDALASSSISRINKTIQITDTGIHPGSGIGNNRKEISKEQIGIPTIAIGVATVVESSIIVNDTITYLFKHLSYIKNNYSMNKLIVTHNKNYLNNKNIQDLTLNEKKEISGILGELDEQEKIELINEVLTSLNYNLIVTPKEIDFLVDKLSQVISKALNKALNKAVASGQK